MANYFQLASHICTPCEWKCIRSFRNCEQKYHNNLQSLIWSWMRRSLVKMKIIFILNILNLCLTLGQALGKLKMIDKNFGTFFLYYMKSIWLCLKLVIQVSLVVDTLSNFWEGEGAMYSRKCHFWIIFKPNFKKPWNSERKFCILIHFLGPRISETADKKSANY